jgi:hypothetical protein
MVAEFGAMELLWERFAGGASALYVLTMDTLPPIFAAHQMDEHQWVLLAPAPDPVIRAPWQYPVTASPALDLLLEQLQPHPHIS